MSLFDTFLNLLANVTVFEWMLLLLLKTDIVVQYLRLKEEQANRHNIELLKGEMEGNQDLLVRIATLVSKPTKKGK